MTRYPDTLTAAAAHAHVDDLLRAAHTARLAGEVPTRRRTKRQRPAWWIRVTAPVAGASAA